MLFSGVSRTAFAACTTSGTAITCATGSNTNSFSSGINGLTLNVQSGAVLSVPPIVVDGLTPSRNLVTLGGGITASMSDRLAFFADYHATLPTGNFWQQTVNAGFNYKF